MCVSSRRVYLKSHENGHISYYYIQTINGISILYIHHTHTITIIFKMETKTKHIFLCQNLNNKQTKKSR